MACAVSVIEYRAFSKNTLQGFVTIRIKADGLALQIKDCAHHRKDAREWIGFPGRKFTDKDGAEKWTNMLEFADDTDREARDRFQAACVEAIHRHLAGKSQAA